MLEIRKNTFSKNYENSFFREFSQHLFNSFKERNLTGVLIGSPLCEADERLQIDALLITTSVVCIIDFKNYSGKIKLPTEKDFEFGLWTTQTGEQIKGGSSINPFVQLRNQKRRFCDVSNRHIKSHLSKGEIFNPLHTVRIVCFQSHIELTGSIPANEALNFFILDRTNFIEGILDIVDVTDKDVKLSALSFDAFKSIFRADLFKFEDRPLEDKLKDVARKSPNLAFDKLYPDQKAALTEIKAFIENSEQQIFVLQGTTNSGKSYLIPFIQELANSAGIVETEVFASSSRVARNLITVDGIENVQSIYSYIYGGHKTEVEEKIVTNDDVPEFSEGQDISDEILLETVPLKNCDNADNAVFIVDESQLISDSYHQSIDLVFGTGFLLRDFLTFASPSSSKRKIIFIGDPYQLQLGNTDESPLNPSYLEKAYKYGVTSFQLLDKHDYSDINRQALTCVRSIRTNAFGSLHFHESQQFSFLSKESVLPCASDLVRNKINGHILTFTNEESQKVNNWIKKSIIKTGEDLAPNDLLLFNNNISIENPDDPFAEPKKVYNGQFATSQTVATNNVSESIRIKGHPVTLKFRELTLLLNDTGQTIKVLCLENYRTNPKAELSQNEIIAFKGILNIQLSKYIKANPFENSSEYSEELSSQTYQAIKLEIDELNIRLKGGEKIKGKLEEKEAELKRLTRTAKQKFRRRIEAKLRRDPSSKYYQYKNAAFLRFGWAITVHKAMSYKWDEIMFNVDQGENIGRTNESHFRWLYTGISRATKKVRLINYKPISPFEKTEFKDNNTGVRPPDIFFHSENTNTNSRLEELKDFVTNKLNNDSNAKDRHYSITNIEHLNWQERYFIKDEKKHEAVISFAYNAQGNFRPPSIVGGKNGLAEELIGILKKTSPLNHLNHVKDEWRKLVYEQLSDSLNHLGIGIESILQTKHKDKVKFYTLSDQLDIEIDYSDLGSISFITAKYYTDVSIWKSVQAAIEQLKN